MSRASVPTLHCDFDGDEPCDAWELDYFAATASTVGAVRITVTRRAPGWTSGDAGDYCPNHGEAQP